MSLKDTMREDASSVFCQLDDFAENVTYRPHRFFGEEARPDRTIRAVVIRESETVLSEDGDTIVPVWAVHVVNSETLGIASEELDTGRDEILLPPRDNQTPEARTIVRIVEQDQGMITLQCQ